MVGYIYILIIGLLMCITVLFTTRSVKIYEDYSKQSAKEQSIVAVTVWLSILFLFFITYYPVTRDVIKENLNLSYLQYPLLIIIIIIPFLVIKKYKEPISSLGLTIKPIIPNIFLILVGIVGILYVFLTEIKPLPPLSEIIYKFLYLLIFIGFGEELFYRGFLQSRLQRVIEPVPAWILVVIIFTISHIPHSIFSMKCPVCLLSPLVSGVFMGFIYMRTQSIFTLVILHAFGDLYAFFKYM